MIIDEDVYLEHFGTKGMRWGVRKERQSSNKPTKTEPKVSNKKRNAAILGGAVAVAAIAAGAIYLKSRSNMDVKMSDIPKASETTKKFTEAMVQEPTGIMHSSRGKNRGYAFLRDGGMKSLDKEFADAGLDKAGDNSFKRFGKDGEKVAARFLDPEGRKDFSGRPIGHDVILPRSMAKDVNNIDDVVKVAWPHIKDMYAPFYRSEAGSYGPGY